jgi:HlyD family secretion protein
MQHKRPPVPVIVLILLVLLIGGYYGIRYLNDSSNGALKASGSIEATIVNISPEMAGKVAEVLVEEGGTVSADDPLLRLDDSLLAAQHTVAASQVDTARAAAVTTEAALASAEHQYELAVQSALIAEQASQARDWRFSAPVEFNQPAWYFTQTEQLDSAQAEVDAAQAALNAAIAELPKVTESLGNGAFLNAEKRLSNARAAFLVADEVKINADNAAEGGGLRDAAYDAYNAALDEVRAAQNEYNAQLSTQSAREVQEARGKVIVAQQRYDAAQARLSAMKTGYFSAPVLTAQYGLAQAKAAAEQAHIAVSQAQANLDLLNAQIAKLTSYAPIDGTLLTRNVEPGEFVQPGATALTLADLSDLTITVYVPEDRYGQISLGQQALVTVDSFPGVTFQSVVSHIADQAEFTPRNVQTVEGRSSTVYAIKLKVTDVEGRLKIGMPADVTFSSNND